MKRTSDSYYFTVSDLNDSKIHIVRNLIKNKNKYSKVQQRVCVMPRLGRSNPNAKTFYNSTSGTVKVEHGTRFDVYVYSK